MKEMAKLKKMKKKSHHSKKGKKNNMMEMMTTMMLAKSMGVGGDDSKAMLLGAFQGQDEDSDSSEESMVEHSLEDKMHALSQVKDQLEKLKAESQ